MALKITNSFGIIEPVDISRIENEIGLKLSKPYIDFLIKSNGGRPNLEVFSSIEGGFESLLHTFYGLYDLSENWRTWSQSIPKNSIPIGCDCAGNQLLLNNESGAISLLDHETNEIILINQNLDSFLEGLSKNELALSDLDKASYSQDIEFFRKIIEAGTEVDQITNEFGQRLFDVACLWGKTKLVRFCLDNAADISGGLYKASENGHLKVVELLLEKGANVDERDQEQNNSTPLIAACHNGSLDVAKVLIAGGADINAIDEYENSALDKARWSDNEELVIMLENLQS